MPTVFASIPLQMAFPDEMDGSIREVLRGEYESGYDGRDLEIVDLGANVGAFTLWANLRWPGSRIHAWEPHPGTFEILQRNVAQLANVTCHNAGVLPTNDTLRPFFSNYAGDGESGFVSHLDGTFARMPADRIFQARVCRPSDLPPCDVLKLDVEGSEADILEHMRLDDTSLILLEFQNDANRQRIGRLLDRRFALEYELVVPWSRLLTYKAYRRELRGDHFGVMFFSNRTANRLQRSPDWNSSANSPLDAATFPTSELLAALPKALYRSLRHRLRG
jgi:FkbM family methyltransferase